MRIGILTGGGDCPGLNAVIMSAVKTAVLKYKDEVFGIKNSFPGLIKNDLVSLGFDDVSNLVSRGGTILGSSNKDDPFNHKGEDGKFYDASDVAIENYRKNRLDAIMAIGGDGTIGMADKFADKGLNIVGVPKTIDNDLSVTHVTFGFDTAVNTVMEAIDRIQTTAESHQRIMLVETMGRDAGWIALFAGIAGGAHMILIPEIDFSLDKIVDHIYYRRSIGKNFTVIVVAEGAKEAGKDQVIKRKVDSAPEKVRLGGVSQYLAERLESMTGIEARSTVLGHIQRGGSPSAFDRILSCRYGEGGIDMIHAGKFSHMVALKTPDIVAIPFKEALSKLKKVPSTGGLVKTGRSIGISFGE